MDQQRQDNTASDLAKGAKIGVDAVKGAKNAAKVVAKAASGNYVGAAVDAVKNSKFLKTVLIVVLCVSFVITILLPMAISEGISQLMEDIAEYWKENFYNGESTSNFINALHATVVTAKNIGQILKDSGVKSFFDALLGKKADDDDIDAVEDADFGIMSSKDDLATVYKRKLDACKNKFEKRVQEIQDIIRNDGQIGGVMQARFSSEYSHMYDALNANIDEENDYTKYEVLYGGTTVTFSSSTLPDRSAVEFICLHTMQAKDLPGSNKVSAFIKWLGYKGGSTRDLLFCLGDNSNITYNIKALKGGFKPQYLVDEAYSVHWENERGALTPGYTKKSEDYSAYECSPIDLLIQVNCPNLYTIQPTMSDSVTSEPKVIDDKTKPIYSYVPASWNYDYTIKMYNKPLTMAERKNGWRICSNAYCTTYGIGGSFVYDSNVWTVNRSTRPATLSRYRQMVFNGYEQKTIIVTTKTTTVSFTVPVSVTCGNSSMVIKMAGMIEGYLQSELDRNPALAAAKAGQSGG